MHDLLDEAYYPYRYPQFYFVAREGVCIYLIRKSAALLFLVFGSFNEEDFRVGVKEHEEGKRVHRMLAARTLVGSLCSQVRSR